MQQFKQITAWALVLAVAAAVLSGPAVRAQFSPARWMQNAYQNYGTIDIKEIARIQGERMKDPAYAAARDSSMADALIEHKIMDPSGKQNYMDRQKRQRENQAKGGGNKNGGSKPPAPKPAPKPAPPPKPKGKGK